MRKLLKLFASLLSFILILSTVTSVGATNELDKLQEKMILQEEAVVAYQNMMKVFDPDGTFSFNYPSNYGGAYVSDSNRLVICLTEINDKIISEYQAFCKNASILDFRKVDYSYQELDDLSEIVYDVAYDQPIVTVSISAKENSIIIGINSSDIDTKSSLIKKRIIEKSNFHCKSTFDLPIKVEYSGLVQTATDLIGGKWLKVSGRGFSLGVCGTYGSSPAFITCGHVFEYSGVGSVVYDPSDPSQSPIGQVVEYQFKDGENFDYAIVRVTNSDFSTTNKVYGANGSIQNITGVYYPTEGAAIYKYGYAAGFASGEVVSVSTKAYFWKGPFDYITIYGLTQVKLTYGITVEGDSGGPCYHYGRICGVTSCFDIGDNTTMYFSPIPSSFIVKTSE
ncbi:MAG TPA: hypothetical protein PK127_05840 [Clostridiales bacterium]|nr:hypothetical protein [Clostridiales bacterium]HPV01980.1 hypothetical protein [Clostridiales bacterium]